jgi:hypothetical protein
MVDDFIASAMESYYYDVENESGTESASGTE